MDAFRVAEDLYFSNTKSKAEAMQCIPYFRNESIIVDNDIAWTFTFDRFRVIDCEEFGEDFAAIRTGEVTYYRPIRRKTVGLIRHACLTELVEREWIEPFLLFVDDRFVKWSDIFVYDDRRYTHLMFRDDRLLDHNYIPHKVDIYHLPFFVKYNEDNIVDDTRQLIFIFNDEGLFDYGGHTRIYMDKTDSIQYIEGTSALGEVWRYDLNLPDEQHVYPTNVIVFKNGLLYRDAKVDIDNYNALFIDDGNPTGLDSITYKIFRDTTTTLENRNIDSIPNHEYLKHLEYNDKMLEMFKVLNIEFDYKFNPDLSYDANIRNFLAFACRYNYRYLIDNIKPVHSKQVSYNMQKLHALMGDDGYIKLPYPTQFHSSCFPLIFVDGYLCNSLVRVYEKNYFEFKFSEVYDKDAKMMEVIFFKSYWDRPLIPFSYSKQGKSVYMFSDITEIDIYSQWHPDKCFEMDDESRCYYTIDKSKYSYIGNELVFNDDSYANKELIITPTHRVVYDKFIMPTDNYRIVLSEKFDFSNREEYFTVFINGKKLNSALYRVIVPSPVRPFNSRSIYFHRMLKKDDLVEVIYSSMSIVDEVYVEDLDHSSESGTGIDALGYITGPEDFPIPLSKNLQFYFINGRKINPVYLQDLSYHMIRTTKDHKSIEDLCIVNFETDTFNEVSELKLVQSLLDETYAFMSKSDINIATNTYAYISNFELAERADFDKEAIIRQIVRDYYVHVNKGVPFRYTYDKDTYVEVDSDGNIILDVIDGTVRKNLRVEEVS